MTPSDYVVCALANVMWNQNPEDGVLGMTLAGLIIRNRVLAGWEDGQWIRLIEKHESYNMPDEGTPVRPMRLGDPHHDILFRRVLAIAENIYNGRERDITDAGSKINPGGGALWYCRLNECSERFKEAIVRHMMDEHPMIATVGRISCFR